MKMFEDWHRAGKFLADSPSIAAKQGWDAHSKAMAEPSPCGEDGHLHEHDWIPPHDFSSINSPSTDSCGICHQDLRLHPVLKGSCLRCAEVSAAEARGRDAAFAAVLNLRADNAQFGIPKYIKDQIHRLRQEGK